MKDEGGRMKAKKFPFVTYHFSFAIAGSFFILHPPSFIL